MARRAPNTLRPLLAASVLAIGLGACGGSATKTPAVTRHASTSAKPPRPARPAAPRPAPVVHSHVAGLVPGATFGVGNVPGCLDGGDPTRLLDQYGAGLLRVIVTPLGSEAGSHGEARPCLQAAKAAGYRVHLVIQYSNVWTAPQTASYFKQVLSYYAPYVWAVSIGNEQELYQGGPPQTGAAYAAVWRALEPILVGLAPKATRVAGEISPWGWKFLQRAVASGLPHAQVFAAHVYTYPYHFALSDFEAWCRSLGVPYWFTEGAYYPGSHAPVVPIAQLAGAQVIESWLGY